MINKNGTNFITHILLFIIYKKGSVVIKWYLMIAREIPARLLVYVEI